MEQIEEKQLERVRRIEKKGISEVDRESRPFFHLSSPLGWMNDPNGFSVYRDEYHLFFQYHPFSNAWGLMNWGHCKSKDFIKWEYLPAALAPDESYDEGGCFSGSAIEVDGEHVLIYTGVIDRYQEDGSHDYRQVQCIAKGDGMDYHKFEGNPVIMGDSIPEGSSTRDFRDPKIWKEEDAYYVVVGSRDEDGGQVLLYRSENLEEWKFLAVLDKAGKKYGKMWECPDFFPLGDKHILLISPQDMRSVGYEFHNGNNSAFICGSYDKSAHRFERESIISADNGLEFYAPQTLLAKDGRRIMIGWMRSWDANVGGEFLDWTGMMTIPRELEYRNGRVYQNPVRELMQYHQNKVEYVGEKISEKTVLNGIRGRVIDLQVEITEFDFTHFGIRFACNEEYEMLLQYNALRKCLTIDRTNSGLVRDVVCRRKSAVEPVKQGEGEILKLRILLDRYSAEIFVNDGEKAMSSLFFTPMEADGIVFESDGLAKINVIKYDICV